MALPFGLPSGPRRKSRSHVRSPPLWPSRFPLVRRAPRERHKGAPLESGASARSQAWSNAFCHRLLDLGRGDLDAGCRGDEPRNFQGQPPTVASILLGAINCGQPLDNGFKITFRAPRGAAGVDAKTREYGRKPNAATGRNGPDRASIRGGIFLRPLPARPPAPEASAGYRRLPSGTGAVETPGAP